MENDPERSTKSSGSTASAAIRRYIGVIVPLIMAAVVVK